MAIREGLVGILALGAVACTAAEQQQPPQSFPPTQYFALPSNDVVHLDDLLHAENVLELAIQPLRQRHDNNSPVVSWKYDARLPGYNAEAIISGQPELSTTVDVIKRDVVGMYGPFEGLILHTYTLTEEQRDFVTGALGIRKVAYVEQRPLPSR